VIKEAYERGYYAIASGDSKSDNPYVKVTQGVEYYAWLGGFNDYDLGYDLDLSVFD
tara:strand:+ start:18889 stop:19056 length:168 start_codon:yes stop_codon:yes gene_type:complete